MKNLILVFIFCLLQYCMLTSTQNSDNSAQRQYHSLSIQVKICEFARDHYKLPRQELKQKIVMFLEELFSQRFSDLKKSDPSIQNNSQYMSKIANQCMLSCLCLDSKMCQDELFHAFIECQKKEVQRLEPLKDSSVIIHISPELDELTSRVSKQLHTYYSAITKK